MIAAIGWIGSALCVASLVQNDQRRFRALNLAACVVFIVFNIVNATWSMVMLNVVIAVINIRQLRSVRRPAPMATSTAPVAVVPAAQHGEERPLVAA
jgi:hypothetical protein